MEFPLPAWRLADGVRSGDWSAREAVEAAAARIEQLDPALNAFTALDVDAALRQADAIDALVAKGGDPGRLAGVPVGVKDLEPAAGLPFTEGCLAFAERIAEDDSIQVARLRTAGALVIGKTNTPEFGTRPYTTNRIYGPTGNPWDVTRTPGGSSGGSAAAVAAGMVPIATGSDGGGSIRIPAALSGCFGIKPTQGRVPRARIDLPSWGWLTQPGPLSWTVRDAARYLDVVSGPHPDDLESLDRPAGGFEAAILREPIRLRRVAWSETLGYAAVEPGVSAVARAAAASLAEAVGAVLDETPDLFPDPLDTWSCLAAPGDLARLRGMPPEQRELLGNSFRKFAAMAEGMPAARYLEALAERHGLNRRMSRFFEEFDLLLTPVVAVPAYAREGPPPRVIAGRDVGPAGANPFTYPFNVTGHPCASVPAGLDGDGLPVGLHVVGPRFDEIRVLQACAALEAARPWDRPGTVAGPVAATPST